MSATKKAADKSEVVETPKVPHTVSTIPVSVIRADAKWNSRVESDNEGVKQEEKETFDALVTSIKDRGLIEPLVVRPSPDGKLYHVVAGFRRFAAVKEAGLKEVACNVVHVEEFEAFKINLAENEQRDALHPYELGKSIIRLQAMAAERKQKLTQEDIGHVIGKSKSHVGNLVRCVTNLAPRALARYSAKLLSMPEALKLAKMVKEDGSPDKDAQLAYLDSMDNARKGGEGEGDASEKGEGGKTPQVLRRPALEALYAQREGILSVKVSEGRSKVWKPADEVTAAEMFATVLSYILKPTKEPPFEFEAEEGADEGEDESAE